MLLKQDINAVKDFLKICKKEIQKGHCYFIGNITINMHGKVISAKQTLLDIGIMNKKQLWQYITELKASECIKVDFDYDIKRDTNSEIFIFKKKINGYMIYIKLTLRRNGVICLSFHQDY